MRYLKLKLLILLVAVIFVLPFFVSAKVNISDLKGKILLQVEDNGEAWYVNPINSKRYFMGRPTDAFELMREFGVGITDSDLIKIESASWRKGDSDLDSDNDGYSDSEEAVNGYNPYGEGRLEIDPYFSFLNAGKIFLQVEQNGEAWYVNPVDGKRYFLGKPADAFELMRSLGLGITNSDLSEITTGDMDGVITPDKSLIKQSKGIILQDVHFAPQAPFGNWSDRRQEDGCEEASVFMAMKWINGRSLTYDEALEEILAIADYEKETYGTYNDTSARDTANWIFKDYYSYNNIEVRYDINAGDVIEELENGNLVIVPVDGRKLGNPYFTQPGPERHMLLIKGYDLNTQEFITNEPGTKRGENYRYKKDVMQNAIRDYVTGFHLPIISEKKAMIIVRKD